MTCDPQLELRVSRLENDSHSLYELVTEIKVTQLEHSRRLDGIDGRLDGIDRRLDRMDARFDRMDERFTGIEITLGEVVRRLPPPATVPA